MNITSEGMQYLIAFQAQQSSVFYAEKTDMFHSVLMQMEVGIRMSKQDMTSHFLVIW